MTASTRSAANHTAAGDLRPRRVPAEAYGTSVIDVSRPVTPLRWSSLILAPIELLALAWSVPVLVLLLMVPVGLALAGAYRVGRFVFGNRQQPHDGLAGAQS